MTAPTDQPWRTAALCTQVDPELFFPEKGESNRPAKRICQLCPVRTECLHEAITRREPAGVWGGLSTRERHTLTRREHDDTGRVRRGRAA